MAELITPIPKPKNRKWAARQEQIGFDEATEISTSDQKYETTSNINTVRKLVDEWRAIHNRSDWHVTPETARLLQHWR